MSVAAGSKLPQAAALGAGGSGAPRGGPGGSGGSGGNGGGGGGAAASGGNSPLDADADLQARLDNLRRE